MKTKEKNKESDTFVGLNALYPGFRAKVWREFRGGASASKLRKKYSLTQRVVEEIIRANCTKPE